MFGLGTPVLVKLVFGQPRFFKVSHVVGAQDH